MSVVYGTTRGAARETIERGELEKRLYILQCYFNHDRYRILGESPTKDEHRAVRVELTKGTLIRQPTFFVVPGPGGRWYVDNMEIAAVKDFCGQGNATGT